METVYWRVSLFEDVSACCSSYYYRNVGYRPQGASQTCSRSVVMALMGGQVAVCGRTVSHTAWVAHALSVVVHNSSIVAWNRSNQRPSLRHGDTVCGLDSHPGGLG